MRIVLLISLYLCLVPGLLLANTHSVQFTESEKALLQMTPEELLNVKLSPQSVQQYWEDHGVTSVSKKGEDPFDTPSAVYVISQEDIQRSGMTSIPELLRMVPGLQVAQVDSHKWAVSSRGFNEQYSSRLRILIDGRSITSPLTSGVFWDDHDLVLQDIDRIEVIRGPGGTIWGENAITGVVNIITKHTRSTQGNLVSVALGSHEKHNIQARTGGQIGDDLSYRFYAKKTQRGKTKTVDDSGVNDKWLHGRAGFRTDLERDNQSIMVSGDVYHTHSENYFAFNPTTQPPFYDLSRKDKETEGANLVLSWEYREDDKISTYRSSIDYFDLHLNKEADLRSYLFDSEFQQVIDAHKQHQFIWGIGYKHYSDSIVGIDLINYTPASVAGNHYHGFLQNTSSVLNDQLFLTLGSKVEHHYYTGLEYHPSAKLAWYPSDKETVWASVARAVRTPTRFERGAIQHQSATDIGITAVVGQPDFNSEKLISYELGYRVRPKRGLLIDTTLFYTYYTDIRTYHVEAPFDNVAVPLVFHNNGKGHSYGMETAFEWQARPDWRLEGSYSFFTLTFEAPVGDFFADERGDPRHQFDIRSQYDFSSDVYWDLNLYYVSKLKISEFQTQKIPAYYRLDTRLAWNLNDGKVLSFVGQNLLDEYHQEFSEGLLSPSSEIGRSFYVQYSWEF